MPDDERTAMQRWRHAIRSSVSRLRATSLGCHVSPWEPASRPALSGAPIFAIGDVHGHLAQLETMLAHLSGLIAGSTAPVELVLIGDYIDRGPANLGVLDRVLDLQAAWGERLHLLLGNHDALLVGLLTDSPNSGPLLQEWLRKDGGSLLSELDLPDGAAELMSRHSLGSTLRKRLGSARSTLLTGLDLAWRCGPYLFTHAGIAPARSLGAQDPPAWLTMREPFLAGVGWSHPFTVVHGHTIRGPEVLPHRIAIDSGVYRTKLLTMLEIRDERLRFHCVGPKPPADALAGLPCMQQQRSFLPVACGQEPSL
jgi:serine/threonine protein phosphatase 1